MSQRLFTPTFIGLAVAELRSKAMIERWLKNKLVLLIIFMLLFLPCLYFIRPIYLPLLKGQASHPTVDLGLEVQGLSEESDLLILHDGGPALLHYSQRKGWGIPPSLSEAEAIEKIESSRALGARFLITEPKAIKKRAELYDYVSQNFSVAKEGADYLIFNVSD